MPLLDVTEVLTDPDFVSSSIPVSRDTVSISSDGILSVVSTTTTTFSGVIVQSGEDTMDRRDDGSRRTDSIDVYTRYMLQNDTPTTTADVITYGGRQYTVVRIQDWSDWGQGFYKATAEMLPLSPS